MNCLAVNCTPIISEYTSMPKLSIYTVGGTVQAGGGLYISRKADEKLLELCRNGTFAYILTSRQVGKSSLMVRTAEQLAKEGTKSVVIDLNQLGVQVTAEAWYLGLLTTIADELLLKIDVVGWWRARADFGVTQRLTQFFQEVALVEVKEPVVIFVDEIDSTLSLDFTDDFFAAIRFLYNARARAPELQRLTFVLIGVATPSDLIADHHRTPFNIGQPVHVTDFTYQEALPLADGLGMPSDKAGQVLHWVMKWTGGHPYLTQRLCRAIAEQYREEWSEAEVDRVTAGTFYGRMSEEDNNLQFVRDMLTKRAPNKLAVMSTYKDIRLGRASVRDEEQSPVKSHLKLSGVVKRENGRLQVRNPIYREVFDRRWIQEHWPVSWWATIPKAVKIATGLVVILLVTSIILLGMYANTLQEVADNKTKLANAETRRRLESDSLLNVLTKANNETEMRRQEAVKERLKADSLAKAEALASQRAEEKTQLAIASEVKTKAALDSAEARRKESESRRQEVVRNRLIEKARTLALQASQELQAGNKDLAGLLARQAFLFNEKHGGPWRNLIHDALMKTLQDEGGPLILRGHSGGVRAITFSNDGDWLVSGGDDATLRLWPRQKNYSESQALTGHTRSVRALAAGSQNGALFSCSDDRTVRWWDMQKGHFVSTPLSGHQERVWAVAESPDGKILATGGADNSVRLWHSDKLDAGAFATLPHPAWVRAVAFSADQTILAVGGDDGTIILWKILAEKPEKSAELRHEGGIKSLTFHPRQLILVSGGNNGKIMQWRVNKIAERQQSWAAHDAAINAITFSRDGRWLATGSSDKNVKLWDFNQSGHTPALVFARGAFVWSVAFNADASLLAAGCDDNNVYLWLTQTESLADKVCSKVKRNLSREEWRAFIGADIEYEKTCDRLPDGKTNASKGAKDENK